jgi:2-polyprenyl-6-methoxyphenol hydroxylase-like FAD-dependent oxidoreductase
MALALSLHHAGIDDVDVYESAQGIKGLGVGINVLPHAVRELTELGLLDDLLRVGVPTRRHGTAPLNRGAKRPLARRHAPFAEGEQLLTIVQMSTTLTKSR